MLEYNLFEVRQNFSKIIDRVIRDDEICIINKANTQVAKIVPIHRQKSRKIGLMKGKIRVSDDFDDPLPGDILDLFEGTSK